MELNLDLILYTNQFQLIDVLNVKGKTSKLSKENIREYIDLVQGDSYLFKGTILENVLLDNKEKIEQKVINKVFKDSELYDDIQRFEEKENTLVGEKGTKLSGGQKQRVAIARSLIKNKPIIVFDEAINKIDNNTKEKILVNLVQKYNDKTMIFITHNLNHTIIYGSCVIICLASISPAGLYISRTRSSVLFFIIMFLASSKMSSP